MNKITVTIDDDFLVKILKQSAQNCNTSVDQIVENILYARFAEHATRAQVFQNSKTGILPELILRDGKLHYEGRECAAFIATIAKSEFSQIKAVNDHLENLSQENFERATGGNA